MGDDASKLGNRAPDGESGSPGSDRGETPHTVRDPYRALFENAPDAILLADEEGRILKANREASRLFGYEMEELVGMEVERLVPAELREAHRSHREDYARDPRPRPMGIGMELAAVRRDGVRVPVEISLSPLPHDESLRVIAVVRDLTERRRLRDFGAGAVRAAEEERRRISRELHDDTAQRLAGLLVRLRVAERLAHDETLQGNLSELRAELHEAAEGVRRVARGLRPPELEDVGLAAALRSHVRERFSGGVVRVDFQDGGEDLPLDTALAVYRIAQEALANAARHSGAERILVRTAKEEGEFVLEVTDDGRGFEVRRLRDAGAGLGLLGMEERASQVGGRLQVTSEPGEGTRVLFQVDLAGEDGSPEAVASEGG